MTKQLTLDEMLECLSSMNHPTAPTCKSLVEAIGTIMADTIAAAVRGVTGSRPVAAGRG